MKSDPEVSVRRFTSRERKQPFQNFGLTLTQQNQVNYRINPRASIGKSEQITNSAFGVDIYRDLPKPRASIGILITNTGFRFRPRVHRDFPRYGNSLSTPADPLCPRPFCRHLAAPGRAFQPCSYPTRCSPVSTPGALSVPVAEYDAFLSCRQRSITAAICSRLSSTMDSRIPSV